MNVYRSINIQSKKHIGITFFLCNTHKLSSYRYVENNDTIFNLATPQGKSGVAIFRISGPHSHQVLDSMTNKSSNIFNSFPRTLLYCNLHTPYDSSNALDTCLVAWFPKPHSFTGEDIVELHTHGSQAIIRSVLSALSTLSHTRPSLPGEFTRRAFINGKLDLTEAEGLGDLINAETDLQRSIALYQMKGQMKKKYQFWMEEMTQLLAQIEAYIDFSEDENIEQDILSTVFHKLTILSSSLSEQLKHSTAIHHMIRDGIHITIAGPPNSGKSTLLNYLARRDAAIVSPIPGTTRDIIQITCQLSGQMVHFYDTAGIRFSQTLDPIEKIGIEKSLESVKACNICIYMLDLSTEMLPLDQWTIISNHAPPTCPFFILLNKLDQEPCINSPKTLDSDAINHPQLLGIYHVSMTSLQNVHEWINALQNHISLLSPKHSSTIITNERHSHHLTLCLTHLSNSITLINESCVFAAEELRQAARHLGQITGSVIVQDDVLSAIFQQFCIGK